MGAGPGGFGPPKAEAKCKISMQFLTFPVYNLGFNDYRSRAWTVYSVVQKNRIPSFILGDNFGNSAPILTILSLSQAEIYGA